MRITNVWERSTKLCRIVSSSLVIILSSLGYAGAQSSCDTMWETCQQGSRCDFSAMAACVRDYGAELDGLQDTLDSLMAISERLSALEQQIGVLTEQSAAGDNSLRTRLVGLDGRLDVLDRVVQDHSHPVLISYGAQQGNDLDHTFRFSINEPGWLSVSAHASGSYDGETASNGALRVTLFVNGRPCGADYNYHNRISNIRFDVSASCMMRLNSGNHALRAVVNRNVINSSLRLHAGYAVFTLHSDQ